MATPVVKWAGGKTRLLPEIIARIPPAFGRYYEPFAGGAALFYRLMPERAVLGDSNPDLITLYSRIKHDVERVIEVLKQLALRHDKTFYYGLRDTWNAWVPGSESDFARAAMFIYLNKTCFNGLWRVNRDGEFNVPMGDYKNPKILDAPALRAASLALQHAEIRFGDYKNAIADVLPGDFVYFDPPYDETFNGYTKEGTFDQYELARVVGHLAACGVKVMVSNSDTPLVRELYAKHHVEIVKCGRAINSDGAKRGAVNEVLVCAGYVPALSQESSPAAEARASHRG